MGSLQKDFNFLHGVLPDKVQADLVTGPTPTPCGRYIVSAPLQYVILTDPAMVPQLVDMLIHYSGLTLDEIATRIGVKRGTLGHYAAGRRRHPSIQWLARLALVCGASIKVEFPSKPLREAV